MTISKAPPVAEESIVMQQALYCLEDNHDSIFASPTTLQLISNICANIVTHPTEEKFRKIKIANPKFNEFVMGVEGAVNLLILCGFEVDDSGEFIILKKDNFVVRDLKDLIAAIDIKTRKTNGSSTTVPTTVTSTVKKPVPSSSSSGNTNSGVSGSSISDAKIEERKKQMLEEKKKIQAEKDKIKQQLQADKEERKHLPTGVCSRRTVKPAGATKKTFGDIGVDLNKGGG